MSEQAKSDKQAVSTENEDDTTEKESLAEEETPEGVEIKVEAESETARPFAHQFRAFMITHGSTPYKGY